MMTQQVDSMYETIVLNIEKLTPEPMEDFFMVGSDVLGVIVQIRALSKDLLQARVASLKTQNVDYFDGSAKELLNLLKYKIEVAAGLIDETLPN